MSSSGALRRVSHTQSSSESRVPHAPERSPYLWRAWSAHSANVSRETPALAGEGWLPSSHRGESRQPGRTRGRGTGGTAALLVPASHLIEESRCSYTALAARPVLTRLSHDQAATNQEGPQQSQDHAAIFLGNHKARNPACAPDARSAQNYFTQITPDTRGIWRPDAIRPTGCSDKGQAGIRRRDSQPRLLSLTGRALPAKTST